MSDSLPLWFLDIDGVLSVNGWGVPHGYEEAVTSDGYRIKWRQDVIDAIREVHEDELFRIVWLTTWGSEANTLFAPLVGLPEFEVASEPYDIETYGADWWKLQVVQKWRGAYPNVRLVWTDDDLKVETVATQWARQHNSYVISPLPYVGLTTGDVGNIRAYARGAGGY